MKILTAVVFTVALCATSAQAQNYRGQLSANPYAAPQRYVPSPVPNYGQPAQLYNQQGQFRGNTGSQYDPNSINNPYGQYGSRYSPDSINNPYGAGSQYDVGSPTNPYGNGWAVIE